MTARKTLLYALLGVAVVAIAVVAYDYLGAGKPSPAPTSAAGKAPPAADEPKTPTSTQADKILALVAQARQQASEARFDDADRSLDEADKVVKDQPEVAQARREIAEMKTPQGQLALQLTRARLAVEHGDKEGAEKALAEVEKLKPDAPEIAELRAKIEHDQKRDEHRDDRVTRHLSAMREAIDRGDLAAAGRELNAAERIAVDDPAVQKARRELNRALNAAQKKD